MQAAAASHFCAYCAVSYFVFRRDVTGYVEPVIEVESEEAGVSIAKWLNDNSFVGNMMAQSHNDNVASRIG